MVGGRLIVSLTRSRLAVALRGRGLARRGGGLPDLGLHSGGLEWGRRGGRLPLGRLLGTGLRRLCRLVWSLLSGDGLQVRARVLSRVELGRARVCTPVARPAPRLPYTPRFRPLRGRGRARRGGGRPDLGLHSGGLEWGRRGGRLPLGRRLGTGLRRLCRLVWSLLSEVGLQVRARVLSRVGSAGLVAFRRRGGRGLIAGDRGLCAAGDDPGGVLVGGLRSEVRRVGKGWRCGWV